MVVQAVLFTTLLNHLKAIHPLSLKQICQAVVWMAVGREARRPDTAHSPAAILTTELHIRVWVLVAQIGPQAFVQLLSMSRFCPIYV